MNECIGFSSNNPEHDLLLQRKKSIHRFKLNYEKYYKLLTQSGQDNINNYWENFYIANPSLKIFFDIMKKTEEFNQKIHCPTPHILLYKKFSHVKDSLAGIFLVDITKANLLDSSDFEINNTIFRPKTLLEAQENFYPSFMALSSIGDKTSYEIVQKINPRYGFLGNERRNMENIDFVEVANFVLKSPYFLKENNFSLFSA